MEQFHETLGEIILANAEITYATVAWTIVHLAQHPEIQQKLLSEIDEVVGRC
jgi:cytochrome P450